MARDAHVVSGVRHHFRRRVRILAAHIGQQDMLTDTNPARDRLTNLTRSDDDNDVFQSVASTNSFPRLGAQRMRSCYRVNVKERPVSLCLIDDLHLHFVHPATVHFDL